MARHGDLCSGGIGHDLFFTHRVLEKPEIGALLVCANRFTRQVAAVKFRPANDDGTLSEKVYVVDPPEAAMEIIRADDAAGALAELDRWRQGLP